jgi:hypothetical protein
MLLSFVLGFFSSITNEGICLGALHSIIDRDLLDDSLRYSDVRAIMTTELGANKVSEPSMCTLGHRGEVYSFQSKKVTLFLSLYQL